MTHKSRKHGKPPAASTCLSIVRATAYLRISEAKPRLPPESIKNQLKMIKEFLTCRPDITLTETYTYVNVSGRSFQRECFRQMIDAIESGKLTA